MGFISVPFLFADVSYEALYSARLERTSQTVMKGTNRPYQLVPPDTTFTGQLEVLLEDDLLGWSLGKPRLLKEHPDADAWLKKNSGNNGDWNQQRVLKELIEDRLRAIRRLGGYRSKGFGRVKIELTPENQPDQPRRE